MGNESTSPSVVSEVLDEPWRKFNWAGKQEVLSLVKEFKPSSDEVNHVRILLYGPAGAGKSSFVNSVGTAVRGRADIQAAFKTHKFRKGETKEYYPFVLNDFMGLESGEHGVRTEDVKLALMGHVRDGYKFNPVSTLSESNTKFYNPSPSADDKVHLLVCVLSAPPPVICPSILEKMRKIRDAAGELGIPVVVIVTQIDELSPEVQKDVKNAFKSRFLKEKMDDFTYKVGIPTNCMFPVKNYSIETENDEDTDTLILTTLKHMLHFADDFLSTL